MTRYLFPNPGFTILQASGSVTAGPVSEGEGLAVTIYADPDATTLADILNLDGNPIAGSVVTTTGNSALPPFVGPEGTARLYGRVGTGAVFVIPVDAVDYAQDLLARSGGATSAVTGPDDLAVGGSLAFTGQALDVTAKTLMDVDGKGTLKPVRILRLAAGSGSSYSYAYDAAAETLDVVNATAPTTGGTITPPSAPRNVTAAKNTTAPSSSIDVAIGSPPLSLNNGTLASYKIYWTVGGVTSNSGAITPDPAGKATYTITGIAPSTIVSAINATATNAGGTGAGEGPSQAATPASVTTAAVTPPVTGAWASNNIPNAMGAAAVVSVDETNHVRYFGGDVGGVSRLTSATDGLHHPFSAGLFDANDGRHVTALGTSPDGSWELGTFGVNGAGFVGWRPTTATGTKPWAPVENLDTSGTKPKPLYYGDVHDAISAYRPIGHRRICFVDSLRVLVSVFKGATGRAGLILLTKSAGLTNPTFTITELDLPIGGVASSFGTAPTDERRVTAIVKSAKNGAYFYVCADVDSASNVSNQIPPGGSGVWVANLTAGSVWSATKIDNLATNPGALVGLRTMTQPKGDAGTAVPVGAKDVLYGVNSSLDTAANAGVWEIAVADPAGPLTTSTVTFRRINGSGTTAVNPAEDLSVIVARRDTTANKTYLYVSFRAAATQSTSAAQFPFRGGRYVQTIKRCMDAEVATVAWSSITEDVNFAKTADGSAFRLLGTVDESSPQFNAATSVANAAQGGGSNNTFDMVLETGGTAPSTDYIWIASKAIFWRIASPWAATEGAVAVAPVGKNYGAIVLFDLAISPDGKVVLTPDQDRIVWVNNNSGAGASYAPPSIIDGAPPTRHGAAAFVRPNYSGYLITTDGLFWTASNLDTAIRAGTWTGAAMTGMTAAVGATNTSVCSFAEGGAGSTVTVAAAIGGKIWIKRGVGNWAQLGNATYTGTVHFGCREGSKELAWRDGSGLWVCRDVSAAAPTATQLLASVVQSGALGYGQFCLDPTDPTIGYLTTGPGQGLTRVTGLNTATPAPTKVTGGRLANNSNATCVAAALDGSNRIAVTLGAQSLGGAAWLESTNAKSAVPAFTDVSDDNFIEIAQNMQKIALGGNSRYLYGTSQGAWVGTS